MVKRRPGPQRIPRPPAARAGGPPPWSDWTGGPITTADVASAVRRARLDEVPAVRTLPEGRSARPSAVLAPFFDEGGEARVILTRRASWLPSHSHQVAFPGGRVEEGESLEDAALREAWEEIGLHPSTVAVVGRLTPLATFTTGASITPFVGILPARPVLAPNPGEVERVFDVPLSELLDPEVFREEVWGVGGEERSVYFFEVDLDTVWGATARMLYELLNLVTATV